MGTDDTTEWRPPADEPLRGVKPLRPEVGAAMNALMALTPDERGYVICWFCPECRAYVGPGQRMTCDGGQHA